ncbi:CLUMA_CG014916, isoform A [Clunio marinus]|uniref:CLUMA_CG014916, isoform A n=1 Tax=Clunio marinus TaxID=568069 RepID=A0A1J1IQ87_9DIPT|nr:CLUMA_CG014916, isoform A [Clunio marinus]
MDNKTDPIVCFPGDRLCTSNENTIPGNGTYERLGYIYSSLAGIVETKTEDKNTIISVVTSGNKTNLPIVGDVVTARVEIVNQRFAKCSVICIGDMLLNRPLRGILRKEDVRATDIDRVEMYKNYRPNDIILAKIIPQIEIHTYSLSTAENELGVVIASARGLATSSNTYIPVPMVPISWSEMQCPNTLVKEPRKVAKIMSENALAKQQ